MYYYSAEPVHVSKVAGFFIRIMTNFDWFAAHFSCRLWVRVCSTLKRWPAVCAFKCQLETLTHTLAHSLDTLSHTFHSRLALLLGVACHMSCRFQHFAACSRHHRRAAGTAHSSSDFWQYLYSRCSRIRMHHLAQQAQLPNYHHHCNKSDIYIKKTIWNMNGTTRPPLDTNSTQLTNWPKIRAARPARGTDPLPVSQVVEVVKQYVGSPWSVSNRITATATTTTSCTHV